MNDRITIADLMDAREQGRKIAAVSCYDYTTARLVAEAGADMILVGDSAAQVILGYDSTVRVTMDFMVTLTEAVRRGAPGVCLVADMPFLSYQTSVPEAIRNAGRFVVEAGAQLVKLEATEAQLPVIQAISDAGIPVMAHIGIRPQLVHKRGVLRAEGTTAEDACALIELADRMVEVGADTLLLEGVAREVGRIVTERAGVPVISCGAGPDCDGQILIITDILGLSRGKVPKFAQRFGELEAPTLDAIASYCKDVHGGAYPQDSHCYHLKKGQFERLSDLLGGRRE